MLAGKTFQYFKGFNKTEKHEGLINQSPIISFPYFKQLICGITLESIEIKQNTDTKLINQP